MSRLPGGQDSLLVRTDFSDDHAWEHARVAAAAENSDGFRAYIRVVDDRAWEGAPWEELREAARAGREHAAVLFIADRPALAEGHPIQVVDLSGESRPPFRCMAQELWSVDNNLNIANMDWEDFDNNTGSDGVFRGFE